MCVVGGRRGVIVGVIKRRSDGKLPQFARERLESREQRTRVKTQFPAPLVAQRAGSDLRRFVPLIVFQGVFDLLLLPFVADERAQLLHFGAVQNGAGHRSQSFPQRFLDILLLFVRALSFQIVVKSVQTFSLTAEPEMPRAFAASQTIQDDEP